MEIPDSGENPENRQEKPESERSDLDAARSEFHDKVELIAQLDLIHNPARWPRRPFLCLEHRTEKEGPLGRPGLLYDGHGPVVFQANLFEIPVFGGTLTEEEFLKRGVAYGSFEEMLEEWRVD